VSGGIKINQRELWAKEILKTIDKWMPQQGMKLLIRTTNELAGIVTDVEAHYESGMVDEYRKLATVVTLNGVQKEFLDYYDKADGRLKDCTIFQNKSFILTARSAFDLEDKGFVWLLPPKRSEELKELEDEISKKNRVISELSSRLDEQSRLKDKYEREAEAVKSDHRSLVYENEKLQKDLIDERRRRKQAEVDRDSLRVMELIFKGKTSEEIKEAWKTGEFAGITDMDKLMELAEKGKELTETLGTMSPGATSTDVDLRNKVKELEGKIAELTQKGKTEGKPEITVEGT